MRHAEQVRLIREALAAIDRGAPPMADAFTRNDPSVYASAERDRREREVLFRRYPIVAGFSAQVRNPGDYFADDLAPVPLLVVRNERGELKAFANICRHRGSRVVRGCGSGVSRFACPYHAWSYDTDGRLRAIPEDYGFEDLDREAHGLVPLPVEERYGLVWVTLGDEKRIAVDAHLGGLAEDLEFYRPDAYELAERRVLRRAMNWKLVSDTFWEAYHIKVLHRTTIAPLFVRNLALFDSFGLCHRLVGIRNSIEELREKPQDRWDLLPHATILMNLFPNTILVMQTDHLEVYRAFPVAGRTDESVTEVSVLVPSGSQSTSAGTPLPSGEGNKDTKWKRVMDLLVGVIEQDFEVGEGIQRNFSAGIIPEVVYGRFEPALAHFHRSIRDALGEDSPL